MIQTLAPPPYIGALDLFTIGIGPSSSHTVGPMRAAADFVARLAADDLARIAALEVTVYGSLAATGEGHGTFPALLLGLEGCRPDRLRADEAAQRAERIEREGVVVLAGGPDVALRTGDIAREPFTVLARHTNGIRFTARDAAGQTTASALYFSVGGGAIVREGDDAPEEAAPVPHPFASAAELLAACAREGVGIAEIARRNELVGRDDAALRAGLLAVRDAMRECVAAGIAARGVLPGGLLVRRRAPGWHERLVAQDPDRDPRYWQEWVNLVALAVNEENAAGGRVVTAPTNGAAGIIPAVLHYAEHYSPAAEASNPDDIAVEFLLTAAAIGALYKIRASISGAEVGCQGEVGSASSMAAGALAAVLGGTPEQIENAAEIAMEHNLGLTCDPVGGLVQIPCIERNALAAGKAINAAKMALWGDGEHLVSLDAVIETMRQTGRDMSDRYKETARGGLAVNVVEC